jgi:hypothetical protein
VQASRSRDRKGKLEDQRNEYSACCEDESNHNLDAKEMLRLYYSPFSVCFIVETYAARRCADKLMYHPRWFLRMMFLQRLCCLGCSVATLTSLKCSLPKKSNVDLGKYSLGDAQKILSLFILLMNNWLPFFWAKMYEIINLEFWQVDYRSKKNQFLLIGML